MRYLLLLAVLSSSYFVEWIPNNNDTATTAPAPQPAPKGEFPWQL